MIGLSQSTEIIIAFVYIFLIVGLNSLIICLFYRLQRSKKITYSDCLFLNLTVSDLFIGVFSISYELYDKFPPFRWTLGYTMCVLFMIQINSQYVCSIMGLLLLSSHRLLQLVIPLKVNENLSKPKIAMIFFTWLVPYVTYGCVEIVIRKPFLCNSFYPRQFTYATLIVFNIMPILAMIVLNALTFVCLLRKKRKQSKLKISPAKAKLAKSTTIAATTDKQPELSLQQQSSINTAKSIQHNKTTNNTTTTTTATAKGSKVSMKLLKDLKGLICVSLIIFTLILTQSIYSVIEPIQFICSECFSMMPELSLISNWLNFSFSILNPIILMSFHDLYRKELIALVGKSKC
jgi:hypothetical protein